MIEKDIEIREAQAEKALRIKMNVPCLYTVKSETTGKMKVLYPSVNCAYNCDTCGWNPAVAKVRIEKMQEEIKKKARAKRCRKS